MKLVYFNKVIFMGKKKSTEHIKMKIIWNESTIIAGFHKIIIIMNYEIVMIIISSYFHNSYFIKITL